MAVHIKRNAAGALWLRALFKFYCRKYSCEAEWSNGTGHAIGKPRNRSQAEYAFEIAQQMLSVRIINALATRTEQRDHIVMDTTRQFVKEVYASAHSIRR